MTVSEILAAEEAERVAVEAARVAAKAAVKPKPAPKLRGPRKPQPCIIDRDRLRELHGEGLVNNELAEKFGVTPSAIGKALKQIELKGNDPRVALRAEREAGVRRLHAEGHSDKKIAKELGMAWATVATIRGQLELPSNFPKSQTFRKQVA